MLLSVSALLLAALPTLGAPATQSPSPVHEARNVLLRGFRERRDFSTDASKHVRRHFVLEDPNLFKRADNGSITQFNSSGPAPQRGANGGPFYHPSNMALDLQNPDNVSPPPTDNGVVPNLKWSFSQSHTRLLNGGWVREQTITDLPSSTEFAAAELTLTPGSYRELHWHRVDEWAVVLSGSGRIAAIDSDGRTSVDDVQTGDLWYFPTGVGHSIQAASDDHLEFLVLFSDGDFDKQGTTFMVDDWLAHTPLDVLAQNLGISVDVLRNIPAKDPYIVRPSAKSPATAQEAKIQSPAGDVPSSFVYKQSQIAGDQKKGGTVKIADSSNFKASENVASAIVTIEPGGLRELHWHPTAEWWYLISGKGRITAFAGSSAARTFDIQVGDSGVIPTNYGHYVQNIGNDSLTILEVFKAKRFQDFSLTQWLALTPTQVVADTLNISASLVKQLSKEKQVILPATGKS